jgi:hypothetical protein
MKPGVRLFFKLLVTSFAVTLLTMTAAAQLPRPGYTFVEVKDELDKPVPNAVGVAYDATGVEIGSGVTNKEGKASLIQNGYLNSDIVIRVMKSGYVTFEARAKAGGRYVNQTIPVKLKERPKEPGPAVVSRPKRRKPFDQGLSPPRRMPDNST